MKRIELGIDEAGAELIDELKNLTGLRTNKEFFDNAITLFDWAVLQAMLGRSLVSLDEQKTEPKQLVMPALARPTRLSQRVRLMAIARRVPGSEPEATSASSSKARAGAASA